MPKNAPMPTPPGTNRPVQKDPVQNLNAFMKLVLSQDECELAYFYEGPVYGCSEDGALQPLFSYHALLRYLIVPSGENTWFVNYRDAGYYGDLSTGKPLTRWTNPYTHRVVEPLPFVEGPGPATFAPHTYTWGTGPKAVATPRDFDYPVRVVGSSTWLEYDIFAKMPNILKPELWPLASTGAQIPINSVVLFRGNTPSFMDTNVRSVPGTQFFDQSILPWMPWMLMGMQTGHLLFRGAGRKIFSLNEVPETRLALLKQLHPAHFQPARSWDDLKFENVWSQFSRAHHPI